ncbi:MAG: vitamin B12-dependent ribonucleotide reductase [Dehalococcoidia bacterium]
MTTTSRRSRMLRQKQRRPLDLSPNARLVLERRYLAKDDSGKPIETPEEMFARVAYNVAQAELLYKPLGDPLDVALWEERFYDLMASLEFLPNSPTLMNAGRELQQLSACFVLPVVDSIGGIFESIKHTALIHKSGGGTGFSFSRLRPEGDRVQSTMGVASGPVSFMKVFDSATEAIKQGGTRRGANMAILSVTHPDIEHFITMKADMVTLTNFNISVAVNEEFMQAVEKDRDYELINPRTGQVVGKRNARRIFQMMVENAWRNGDPGIVFIDRINRDNPTPNLGTIEATNPCGEQPLLPYESCNLGSLNLSKFVRQDDGRKAVDWERLASTVPLCIRFLDNVIDVNRYPIPEIEEATRLTRKVGLGVMGFHDLLLQLGIPYDSEEALRLAEQIMAFIQEKANQASIALGEERGVFPAWEGSIYGHPSGDGASYRNASRTTIAPTGTLSIIADCSSGIEPLYALAFQRTHYLDPTRPATGTRLIEVNRYFTQVAKDEGFYSDELIEHLAAGGCLADRPEVPDWVKRLFVTAHDIAPQWHVRMQAAFQHHTDNAVSKTINFPQKATQQDIADAYWLAYREGCKGITVYRDGCREMQVLAHTTLNLKGPEQEPENGERAAPAERRPGPYRERLPDERQSITHKFAVGEQEGYLTVGLYEDGRPGEIFVKIAKEGSTVSGLMDAVALLTSVSMQYGVPLEDITRKLKNTRFEPYGRTNNPHIPWATSLVDYIFRWLELKFVPGAVPNSHNPVLKEDNGLLVAPESSGLGCPDCGAVLIYQEGCLVCRSCGYTKCG